MTAFVESQSGYSDYHPKKPKIAQTFTVRLVAESVLQFLMYNHADIFDMCY